MTSQKLFREEYQASGRVKLERKRERKLCLCKRNVPLMKESLSYQTHHPDSCLNDAFQYLSYVAVSDSRMCEHGSAVASGEMEVRYHLTQRTALPFPAH